MSLFNKLFGNNSSKVECQRCLGKGHVDKADIKRLNKELKWMPGSCAYCNGTGKVDPELMDKLPVDMTYLTINLSVKESKNLANGDEDALSRAKKFDQDYDSMINLIRDHYLLNNWEAEEIAEFFYSAYPETYTTDHDKQQLLDYIHAVISNTRNEQEE